MTLVIELEQRFQSVAQIDRRAISQQLTELVERGVSRRWKRSRRWSKKKRAPEDGRTETSMYKSAEARDYLTDAPIHIHFTLCLTHQYIRSTVKLATPHTYLALAYQLSNLVDKRSLLFIRSC
jgi:hypothetical protein